MPRMFVTLILATVTSFSANTAHASQQINSRVKLTGISRDSRLLLTSDLIVPANTASVSLEVANDYAHRAGVIWCSLNLHEPSLDTRLLNAGRTITFTGVIVDEAVRTQSSEPQRFYRVEMAIGSPEAFRSLECNGARYDSLHNAWVPIVPLIEDLRDAFSGYGKVVLAEPVEIP